MTTPDSGQLTIAPAVSCLLTRFNEHMERQGPFSTIAVVNVKSKS